MRRYNIVPLILFLISIINFALAAPVLIPEKCQACVDVVHVPKDVTTVLGKRGDELAKLEKLFDNFDRWWGDSEDAESSSDELPPSSSALLESGQGSTQVHVPPANPASSTESDRDPESSAWHPPTPSTASSSESDSHDGSIPSLESDSDSEEIDVDHNAPPPDPELIESGPSHTLPSSPEWSTESEHRNAPPTSTGSDSDSV